MKLINFTFSVFIMFGVFMDKGFSQYDDDANKDRIPYNLLLQSQIMTPKPAFMIVTNSVGFENFFLGVDFAEPHMSVNPQNPLWYFTAFNTNATHYTLNGANWLTNNPVFGFTMMGDPVTAYDSLGNVYYDNMYGDGSNVFGTKIVKSTNNGQTWLPSVSGNTGNDKNWIAADQTGGPYANYVYGTITPGNFIRSTNLGASFAISATFSTQSLPGMMVCVGPQTVGTDVPGGCVYVVTNSGGTFTPTYSFYVSTNGGASFILSSQQAFAGYVGTNVGGRHSVQNMRTRPYPFITADNSYGALRGRLYLVYATNTPAGNGNKPDIFCRYSTNKGVSWSSAVQINDDVNPTANHQWHPSTWCDKRTGRFYVKWFDTRLCSTSDSADVYASYSDDGGNTFVANQRITTASFKIDCSTCGGGGTPRYQGDYDAITSYGKTSLMVWSDFRNGQFGSYTAYFPDYAMRVNPTGNFMLNNDSIFVRVSVPGVKLYTDAVKFTAEVDTLPASGSFNFSFANGRDSISTFPDSVNLRVKTVGTVTPGLYGIIITGKGPNGIPVHKRIVDVYVNAANVSIGTNREGLCAFKVNGVQYTSRQNITVTLGQSVTVQAISPAVVGNNQYVYTNWSDGGDTTHTFTVNNPLTLTANYKVQYKLLIISSVGNTFGGNIYYDSAASFTFGVLSRTVISGGQTYRYRGFTGAVAGSYTSPDSTGADSAIVWSISAPTVESCRWMNITGITNISSEIPKEYKLYQNYPNPFNPSTTIDFDILKAGNVKITVYDALGREVQVLTDEVIQPGRYKAVFEASGLSSGIYFYKIVTGDFNAVKRMLMIK